MGFRIAQQSLGLAFMETMGDNPVSYREQQEAKRVFCNKCPQLHVWFQDTDHQLGHGPRERFFLVTWSFPM